jgi:hypothetical protein
LADRYPREGCFLSADVCATESAIVNAAIKAIRKQAFFMVKNFSPIIGYVKFRLFNATIYP